MKVRMISAGCLEQADEMTGVVQAATDAYMSAYAIDDRSGDDLSVTKRTWNRIRSAFRDGFFIGRSSAKEFNCEHL